MPRFIDDAEFKYIKQLLSEEGATVDTVRKQLGRSWDTVNRVHKAERFEDMSHRIQPRKKATPRPVRTDSELVVNLLEQRASIIQQFDDMIATLRKLERY